MSYDVFEVLPASQRAGEQIPWRSFKVGTSVFITVENPEHELFGRRIGIMLRGRGDWAVFDAGVDYVPMPKTYEQMMDEIRRENTEIGLDPDTARRRLDYLEPFARAGKLTSQQSITGEWLSKADRSAMAMIHGRVRPEDLT